jgi:hypothetical protein
MARMGGDFLFVPISDGVRATFLKREVVTVCCVEKEEGALARCTTAIRSNNSRICPSVMSPFGPSNSFQGPYIEVKDVRVKRVCVYDSSTYITRSVVRSIVYRTALGDCCRSCSISWAIYCMNCDVGLGGFLVSGVRHANDRETT